MERYEAAMSTVKSAAAKSAAHAKEIGDKTIDHTIDFARRSEAYYQTSQRRMEEVRLSSSPIITPTIFTIVITIILSITTTTISVQDACSVL